MNIRPTPFKLVLKLYLSCLNMADEREILGLSNASNHNLENALILPKQKTIYIFTFTCHCRNLHVAT